MVLTTSRIPHHLGSGFIAFVACQSQQVDGFQHLVDLGSSKHFIDPDLVRGVESRIFE